MKIKYYLANKNTHETSIVLTVREGSSRNKIKVLRIGTGITIETSSWDSLTGTVKRNYSDSATVNRNLTDIARSVEDLYQYAKRTLKVDPFLYIKEELPKIGVLERPIPMKEVTQAMNVLDCFNQFIEVRKNTDAKATIKIYTTTYNHLCKFIGSKRNAFTFDKINSAFHDRYVNYLLGQAKLTNNTVGKHLMIFKTFLHWAAERGFNTYTEYKKLFNRSEFEVDTTTIALSSEELTTIEGLELMDNPRLDRVRDLFLISCYTGMRFSDVSTLQPHYIQDGMIRLVVTKTKTPVSIPITPRLKLILDKYPDFLFPIISNQKANEYLKEIGKLAKLDSKVEIIRFRGGDKLSNLISKWEVLCTHTARRTFITLSLQKGLQPETVRRVSGHKDLRSFQKYIKHSDDYLKSEMSKAWS